MRPTYRALCDSGGLIFEFPENIISKRKQFILSNAVLPLSLPCLCQLESRKH